MKTEKSDSTRNRLKSRLCMEPHTNGRMGSSPKPYFTNYHCYKTIENERLC